MLIYFIRNKKGHTVGAFPLGALVGGLATNYLNSLLSRRVNLIVAAFWNILGSLLSAVAVSVEMVRNLKRKHPEKKRERERERNSREDTKKTKRNATQFQ